MKKFRILLVAVFMITFLASYSQNKVNFRVNSNSAEYFIPDEDRNYYVFNYPKLSGHELFNRVKMGIFEVSREGDCFADPNEVTDEMLYIRADVSDGNNDRNCWIRYAIIFKFKDGKIRVNRPVIVGYNCELKDFPNEKFLDINYAINKILSYVELEEEW